MFTLQVKSKRNSCFFLQVPLRWLGSMASLTLCNYIRNMPGSSQNGLQKRSEVLVRKVAPKAQPISVAMSLGFLSRDSWERLAEILSAMLLAIFEILLAT